MKERERGEEEPTEKHKFMILSSCASLSVLYNIHQA
jgi:hypothetical protein